MKLITVLSALLVLGQLSRAAPLQAATTPTVPKDDPKIAALIDQLQLAGTPGAKVDEGAWIYDFLATDGDWPTTITLGYNTPPQPDANATMRRLVQIGYPALPTLINHLSDGRPTHVTEQLETFFNWMVSSDEYDPRYNDPKRYPPGVKVWDSSKDWKTIDGQYNFKVGDLCYEIIGQIVNRRLRPVRGQATGGTVIVSPIENPNLVAAIKQDWAGISESDYKTQLVNDVISESPFNSRGGLERLLYYYPKTGEDLTLKLLSRPLYSSDSIFKFIYDRLLKTEEPSAGKQIYQEAVDKFGPDAAFAIPHWLYWVFTSPYSSFPEKDVKKGKALMAALFPDYSVDNPKLLEVADINYQADVIPILIFYKSAAIDKACYDLFKKAQALPQSFFKDNNESDTKEEVVDHLVENIVTRAHTAKVKESYRKYLMQRIAEQQPTDHDEYGHFRVLKGALDTLNKSH